MSDRLGKILCEAALAVIFGAWFGSVAAVISWHVSAPTLPDRAWGRDFAADLFPEARGVAVDLVPEIAQYEEAEVQESRFGFFFLGGDDYFPGQLIIAAQVDSARDFVANVDPVLRKWGWTVGSHAPGEDVTAAAPNRTLWVTESSPNEVEVTVYRQTPNAVLWATGTAWLAGAVLGFVLGSHLDLGARSRPLFGALGRRLRLKPIFIIGAVLSAPAAIVASVTVVLQVFGSDDMYPFTPWDVYMYAIFRPLAVLGLGALCVSAVLFTRRERGPDRTAPGDPIAAN